MTSPRLLRPLLLALAVVSTHCVKVGEPTVGSVQDDRSAVQNEPPAAAAAADGQDAPAELAEAASDRRSLMEVVFGLQAITECTDCLKECIAIRAQKAQTTVVKFQAPVSLITWYLFKNRPFKMWPLEDVIKQMANVHPGIYASGGAGMYLMCQQHCDMDCPYPGNRERSEDEPILPELAEVDANDHSFLSRMLYRGAGRGGGGGGGGAGGLGDAVSKLFQIV